MFLQTLLAILLIVMIVYFVMKNPFYQAYITAKIKNQRLVRELCKLERKLHVEKHNRKQAEEGLQQICEQHADLEAKFVSVRHQLETILMADTVIVVPGSDESFNAKEVSVDEIREMPVSDAEDLTDGGTVYLVVQFEPDYVKFNGVPYSDGEVTKVLWRGQEKPKFEKIKRLEPPLDETSHFVHWTFENCQLDNPWAEIVSISKTKANEAPQG